MRNPSHRDEMRFHQRMRPVTSSGNTGGVGKHLKKLRTLSLGTATLAMRKSVSMVEPQIFMVPVGTSARDDMCAMLSSDGPEIVSAMEEERALF